MIIMLVDVYFKGTDHIEDAHGLDFSQLFVYC